MRTSPPQISRFRRWVGLVLLVVFFGIAIAFSVRRLQPYEVTSGSMSPTILPGDRIVVYARLNAVPKRGSIVAVRNPKDADDMLCKRVVAVPGDEVEIRGGRFYLNGLRQDDERYVKTERMWAPDRPAHILLGDEYFVLGDNREASMDSGEFGPVRARQIIGVALCIYWPLGRIRSLRPPADSGASAR